MHADEPSNCLTNQWQTHTDTMRHRKKRHTYTGMIPISSATAELRKGKY